jgi:hypothetical protein
MVAGLALLGGAGATDREVDSSTSPMAAAGLHSDASAMRSSGGVLLGVGTVALVGVGSALLFDWLARK